MDRERRRRVPALWVAALAAVVFIAQLAVLSDTGEPPPAEVAERFVEAFNTGDSAAVRAMLVEEPSMLSWPAGPPWGGLLQWTLQLLPAGASPSLTHSADLDAYVGYHRALDGALEIDRCVEEPQERSLELRTWVRCRFSQVSDLSRALDARAPTASGVVRFGIEDSRVDAVVVESWEQPAPSGAGFLLWVQATRPDVLDGAMNGRLTVSDYRAETAKVLLDLARGYRTLRG